MDYTDFFHFHIQNDVQRIIMQIYDRSFQALYTTWHLSIYLIQKLKSLVMTNGSF